MPVRPAGLVLTAAGLSGVFLIAPGEVDHVVHAAAITALALVGLCLLLVIAGALVVRRAARRSSRDIPDRLETLQPTPTEFRMPRLRGWPLVEARLQWEAPAHVDVDLEADGGAFTETVTAHERGRHSSIVRHFIVEDVLGLTRIGFRLRHAQALRIVPRAAAAAPELAASFAPAGDTASHQGRSEGDLVEMRQYGPGDPLRNVLWKTFARTRRLLVRMPERAVAPRPSTVAFLLAGPGDEASSALARLCLERGLFGADFRFAADGADAPVRELHQAIEQIIDSAQAREQGGARLIALAEQVEAVRLGGCIVFVPAVDGPWRPRLIELTRRLPSPPTVVIGVEGSAAAPARPRGLSAWLWRAPPGDRGDAELSSLRRALEAEGLKVQVMHREGRPQ